MTGRADDAAGERAANDVKVVEPSELSNNLTENVLESVSSKNDAVSHPLLRERRRLRAQSAAGRVAGHFAQGRAFET
jgi:hypothetical protein